ncbi:MAG: hypothetical protein KH247_00060 [Haemophilus parainfluenzae]|jgi:hypothetical protein|nr:hypothetical protein [Haemophilus parainfluenzae]
MIYNFNIDKENFIQTNIYNKSSKELVVGLKEYHRYWYDLIVFPNAVSEYFNSRELITKKLSKLKKEIETCFQKHFVYFILSRKIIRFNTFSKPIVIGNEIHLSISIGKEKEIKDIKIKLDIKPYKVELLDKYITIWESKYCKSTFTIHEFIDSCDIDLGIANKVEYVGYTRNPEIRPTNGSHTGLSDTLYKVSTDENDIFILFNIFETLTSGIDDKKSPFIVMNSIEARIEGLLLEKCFIVYFNSDNQARNKITEHTQLIKTLKSLNIKSVIINYELSKSNDYSIFESSHRKKSTRHFFKIQIINNKIKIDELSNPF